MGEFDLDLQSVEAEMDDDGTETTEPEETTTSDGPSESEDGSDDIVLGVLDGTTDDDEWRTLVEDGQTLLLNVEGDVNERAAGFARDVVESGGELMHFRGFLIAAPPGVSIDASRVG